LTSILLLVDQALDLAVVLVELVALSGGSGLVGALLGANLLVFLDEFLPSVVLWTALAWTGAVDLGTGSILVRGLARSALAGMTPYEFSLSSLVCLFSFS